MTQVVLPEITPNTSLPEHAVDIVERMNRSGLQDATSHVMTVHDPNTGVGMLVTRPDNDSTYYETTERNPKALVRLQSFANGNTPWNRVYLQFLANATDHLAVAILSPSTDGSEYNLGGFQWDQVEQGNFFPIGRANERALSSILPHDIESLGIMGWSQGGNLAPATAISLSDSYGISGVAIGDPTSVAQRGLLRLLKDLGASGYKDIRSEIEETGFDIALEALRFTGDQAGDFTRTVGYLKDMLSEFSQNLHIARGLGRATLAHDLVALSWLGMPTTIAHAKDSAVCKSADFSLAVKEAAKVLDEYSHNKFLGPIQPVLYSGNHAASDHMGKQYDMAVRALNV